MKEKKEVVKIKFFKKIWYSITKFEKYPEMAAEGLKKSIIYLMILTAIVAIFSTIGSLIGTNKTMQEIGIYIKENIPEFAVENGNLTMEIEEPIIINDAQGLSIDKIIINPLAETEEQKNQSENENITNGITLFLFKNEIILETKTENNQILKQEYTYSEFVANYTGENIETFNKTELVQYITEGKMLQFYSKYAVSIFVYLFVANIIIALCDAIEIAILGWITTAIAKMKMKFKDIYNMAIYSLTLPMILNILYIIVNYFTDFTITYFQVAYITIAYIYLAATIFIIKDDYIKRMQEVYKIKQEQKKVREEIKKQEEDKKEEPKEQENDRKEEKKEDGQEDEPEGSQA